MKNRSNEVPAKKTRSVQNCTSVDYQMHGGGEDIREFKTEAQRVNFEWVNTTQNNSAEIVKAKPSCVEGWIVVLAKYRSEWVVWNMCEETQEFQSGRYCQLKRDALKWYREAR